jgi:hypothetical protein
MTCRSLFSVVAITMLVASGGTSQVRGAKSFTAYGVSPEAIDRVEILYYPEHILTRIALTPEMLEQQYQYKVEVREFVASTQRQQLVLALREISLTPSSRSFDLRTAILLYDKSGKRVMSLYFDRGGKNGVVNRETVSTSDGVYRWAKSLMRGFSD